MSQRDRQPVRSTLLVGLSITLIVLLLDQTKQLDAIERRMYDRRARDCQFFMSPPTDRLVHIDIDDRSLDVIGRWPWPRSEMARLLREIHRAGPKVVGLDIILAEVQQTDYVAGPDGSATAIDHDAEFERAMREAGNVVLAIAFAVREGKRTELDEHIAQMLRANLEIGDDELIDNLKSKGLIKPDDTMDPRTIGIERRGVMQESISRLLSADSTMSQSQLRESLFPRKGADIVTQAVRVMLGELSKVESFRHLAPFSQPVPAGLRHHFLEVLGENPPLPRFAAEAASSGFVDYISDHDGVIREVPLWVRMKDRVYPQLALAMACRFLDVPITDLRFTEHSVIIPRAGQADIVIPVTHRDTSVQDRVGMVVPVPWFGPAGKWERMYDWPDYVETSQHLSASYIWYPYLLEQRINNNCAEADGAIAAVLNLSSPTHLAEFESLSLAAGDVETRVKWIGIALSEAQFMVEMFEQMTPEDIEADVAAEVDKQRQGLLAVREQLRQLSQAEYQSHLQTLDREDRAVVQLVMTDAGMEEYLEQVADHRRHELETFLPSVRSLPELRKQLLDFQEQLTKSRVELAQQLGGRAVMIGWTATGKVDYMPTSLHARCPGVVSHGVLFNGILTGEMWRVAPTWVSGLFTICLGVIATLLTALIGPVRSLLAVVLLGLVYWVFNGIVLFDYGNTIVGVAGPVLAIGLVWPGGTLTRFISERAERQRIKRRFESYVDPVLVDYVLEKRDQARFDGEQRELTVVFTDLAGFTTISERLQEATVPLLNDYMELMVPIIREHRGYVNKFLGDGIMFFYGAPRENSDHAINAVQTVLQMQIAIAGFNERLLRQDLPAVEIRCGVNSGLMIVGDAGPADASDYTVLGDSVNLAARLESANKATGTRVMIGRRTAELLHDRYLLRPLGSLQVVGKSRGVMTYEPLCLRQDAKPRDLLNAEISSLIVDLFIAGRFAQCLEAVSRYEQEVGTTKLMVIYRRLCGQHIEQPPDASFNGSIVLDSK